MFDYLYYFRSRDLNNMPQIIRNAMRSSRGAEFNSKSIHDIVQKYLFGKPTSESPDKTTETTETTNTGLEASGILDPATDLEASGTLGPPANSAKQRKHPWQASLDNTMFYI
jgi:hypothetical protein